VLTIRRVLGKLYDSWVLHGELASAGLMARPSLKRAATRIPGLVLATGGRVCDRWSSAEVRHSSESKTRVSLDCLPPKSGNVLLFGRGK
jgi:hypothetical protein